MGRSRQIPGLYGTLHMGQAGAGPVKVPGEFGASLPFLESLSHPDEHQEFVADLSSSACNRPVRCKGCFSLHGTLPLKFCDQLMLCLTDMS